MSDLHEEEEFCAAIHRLASRMQRIEIAFKIDSVVTIIATMQLALRHPGFVGPTALQARALCDRMIANIEAEEPVLGVYLRRGYDPAHDVPREKFGNNLDDAQNCD